MRGSLLLDEEERQRVNPFDWQAAFPQVFAQGGFDAVIGNPPWGASYCEDDLIYLREKYRRVISRMIDSYIFFVFQSIKHIKNIELILG